MAQRLLTEEVVGARFAFYEADEVRRLSVKRIVQAQTFDMFAQPTVG